MEFMITIGMLAVFLLVVGITLPKTIKRDIELSRTTSKYYSSRSIGSNKLFRGITEASIRRAMRTDGINAKYLSLLKQANWYWEPGETINPNPKAPFWNVETLWGEKIFGAILFASMTSLFLLLIAGLISLVLGTPLLTVVVVSVGLGALFGIYAYQLPDRNVAAAASRRQRELSLEMGYRIPELRADVMSGNTIQRAMRNLSIRPGGPFVEELRRAVVILDVTKDDVAAMDQLIDRNGGNELLAEYANSVKMVSRQGGQIGPVLNVLTDQAQQHLRLSIQGQARKNLQEMARPVGLGSLIVTSLLIIVPAVAGVLMGIVQMSSNMQR